MHVKIFWLFGHAGYGYGYGYGYGVNPRISFENARIAPTISGSACM